MSYDDPFNTPANDGDTNDNFYNFKNDDPAAEFLEREKRELGDITGNDDADSFNSQNNSLTNGAHSPIPNEQGNDYSSMESNPKSSQYQALSHLDEQMNEPETIKKWREEFAARITKKDTEEESKQKEMREQAKKELDDFYKQRVEQMERIQGENRTNNHTLEDDLFKNGNTSSNDKVHDWDKITSLCEFNPKNNRSQKDLTRYRSILLQLKQQQQQQSSGK